MRDERGFALLAVLLVLALLGVVVTEFALTMRLEASMVLAYREALQAGHLAEAAVQQAIREVLTPAAVQGLDEAGGLAFYRVVPGQTLPVRLPGLPRERVPLGPGEFSYRITDEEGRLNLNAAARAQLERLLAGLEVPRGERDIVLDSLEDWKDPNDLHRANGAESPEHYLRLPVPYRARNGPLQDAAELLQIRGVTPDLYRGAPDRPGLGALVRAHGGATVNINTAPAAVLRALGLSEAEVADVTQARAQVPYTVVPGRFAGRGLAVGSATFRIEAEGRIGGEPRARVVAIVQRRMQQQPGGGVAPGAAILSWRPDGERPAP